MFTVPPRVLEATASVGKLDIALPAGAYAGSVSSRVRVGPAIVLQPGSGDHRLDVRVTLGAARITATHV